MSKVAPARLLIVAPLPTPTPTAPDRLADPALLSVSPWIWQLRPVWIVRPPVEVKVPVPTPAWPSSRPPLVMRTAPELLNVTPYWATPVPPDLVKVPKLLNEAKAPPP